RGTRDVLVLFRRIRAARVMDAFTAIRDPAGQGRVAHGFAGGDVFGDPVGHLLPAGSLPGFERPELPAVAPADGEVDVARGLGDVGQVVGTVVEQVAEGRPQELRLRVGAFAQLAEFFGRI